MCSRPRRSASQRAWPWRSAANSSSLPPEATTAARAEMYVEHGGSPARRKSMASATYAARCRGQPLARGEALGGGTELRQRSAAGEQLGLFVKAGHVESRHRSVSSAPRARLPKAPCQVVVPGGHSLEEPATRADDLPVPFDDRIRQLGAPQLDVLPEGEVVGTAGVDAVIGSPVRGFHPRARTGQLGDGPSESRERPRRAGRQELVCDQGSSPRPRFQPRKALRSSSFEPAGRVSSESRPASSTVSRIWAR